MNDCRFPAAPPRALFGGLFGGLFGALFAVRFGALFAALFAILSLLAGAAQATNTNFSGAAVAGCTYSNATYTCTTLPLTNDTDSITVASGYTVIANPAVTFTYNQSLTLSGSAVFASYGNLNIADVNPAHLHVSGGYLASGANFKMGTQAQTIGASIYAASVTIGSGSATKINGFVYSQGQIDLGSNVTIVGDVTGTVITTQTPVAITGTVSASTSLTLASGSSVTGNVSGGALTLLPSGTSITGTVKMTGDVDIGSGDTIKGDLTAHNVTTEQSNGIITGNASVNAITLNTGGRVQKKITCTASGASGCSCVTDNSGFAAGSASAPQCTGTTPPPAPTLDHILITHDGNAATCAPKTVTLTACANSACSSQYTGTTSGTLSPGGTAFSFSGGSGSGAVQQSAVTTVNMTEAAGSGSGATTNTYSCYNSATGSNSCAMAFASSNLSVMLSHSTFYAETPQTLTVTAVTSSTSNPNACLPLLKNQVQSINFSCAYNNPASGTLPLRLTNNSNAVVNAACNGATTAVSAAFDANGSATIALSYADVGKVTLTGSYTTVSSPTSAGTALSSTPPAFFSAPQYFTFAITNSAGSANPAASYTASSPSLPAAFVKAGETFTASLVAASSLKNRTPNFGNESPSESYTFTSAVALPTAQQQQADANFDHPTISGNFGPMSNGATTISATQTPTQGVLSWDAVGMLNFSAVLTNSNGYLGTGLIANGSTNVGRFVPDHLGTALGSIPMPCSSSASAAISLACVAPNNTSNGKFIYSKQAFDVIVTAYNSNSVSKNYDAGYGLSQDITLAAYSAAGSAGSANPGGGTLTFSAPPLKLSKTLFAHGVSKADTHLPEYDFPGTAVVAPTTIYVRAIDDDAASSLRTSAGTVSIEAPVSVVSGRMRVNNAYGAPQSQTPVTVTAQYWTGSAYVANPAYNTASAAFSASGSAAIGATLNDSSSSSTANVQFSACTGNLAAAGRPSCQSSFFLGSNTTLVFNNGVASFVLKPVNINGTVLVTLGTLATPSVSPIVYLPSTSGTLTFGTYRSGPVIYTREVY